MSSRAKLFIVLFLVGAVWLAVLLRLGLWHQTVTPADGYVSHTYNGWAQYPVSRHLFLAQLDANGFAQGRPYVSGTYPSIFVNFLVVAPFHFLLGLPYNVAHNFLPYFYIFCLTIMLVLTARKQLLEISSERRFLLWFLVFISVGIFITDPLPWTSSFNAARNNAHILTAGAFCYLSTFVFYNKTPKTPLLIVGIFLAMWAPNCIPAWILAGLFFNRTLVLERKWILQVVGVCTLAVFNTALPRIVCRLAGVEPTGSTLFFRSGLDGSTVYMTSILQGVVSPADPRHWPTAFYFLLAALLAIGFHYFFKRSSSTVIGETPEKPPHDKKQYRPLSQACFLLIPYLTFAIFLPQLTSIHPYHTDLFLFIPATFLMSFWFLQKPFWASLTGKTYVGWLLLTGLILMTNLLTVAQMPRFTSVERRLPLVAVIIFVSGLAYLSLRYSKWFRRKILASR